MKWIDQKRSLSRPTRRRVDKERRKTREIGHLDSEKQWELDMQTKEIIRVDTEKARVKRNEGGILALEDSFACLPDEIQDELDEDWIRDLATRVRQGDWKAMELYYRFRCRKPEQVAAKPAQATAQVNIIMGDEDVDRFKAAKEAKLKAMADGQTGEPDPNESLSPGWSDQEPAEVRGQVPG